MKGNRSTEHTSGSPSPVLKRYDPSDSYDIQFWHYVVIVEYARLKHGIGSEIYKSLIACLPKRLVPFPIFVEVPSYLNDFIVKIPMAEAYKMIKKEFDCT